MSAPERSRDPEAAPGCAFDATADAVTRATGGRVRGTVAWMLGITLLAMGVAATMGIAGWFLS